MEQVRRAEEKRRLLISVVSSTLFKCALDPFRLVASGYTFGKTTGREIRLGEAPDENEFNTGNGQG
jgi:hypothetical protein